MTGPAHAVTAAGLMSALAFPDAGAATGTDAGSRAGKGSAPFGRPG